MKPTSTSAPRTRKSVRPTRRLTRRSVLKMLAVMEHTQQSPDSSHDPVHDFLQSGRTGRRNALPDILGEHATTSTADLPACLHKLSASASEAAPPPQPAPEPAAEQSGAPAMCEHDLAKEAGDAASS